MTNPYKSFEEVTAVLIEHGHKAAIDILMKAQPDISDEVREELFTFYCQSHFHVPDAEIFYCAYVQSVCFGKELSRLKEQSTNPFI
jgi:hypothetical protein